MRHSIRHSVLFRIVLPMLFPVFFSGLSTATAEEILWESSGEYVKIVPRDGGDANRHPFKIDSRLLAQAFAKLRVEPTKKHSRDTLGGNEQSDHTLPLFTSVTVQRLAKHIADGLRRVGPNDDIVFRSVDTAPMLGGAIGKQVFTTGRVFWHDRRLHLIFGAIHKNLRKRWLLGHAEGYMNAPDPGRRDKATALKLRIVRTQGIGNAKVGGGRARVDWIMIEPRTLAQTPEKIAPASAPEKTMTLDQSSKERLERLEELRREGLISEREYKKKRRQVLNEL